jgi:Flp pilus assembly protein TadD
MKPDNISYIRNLAVSLRVLGRHEDAERVLLQALREKPADIDLNEELAKTMIASGRLRDGVVLIEKVASLSTNDAPRMARLYSATGVAFDRAEKHAKAQEQYRKALSVQPYNATALNNMGLSYAMDNKLDQAEQTLRRALVAPSAGTQVRQNLAMVLSLQGKTDEARRLVSQDLPPSMANQTVGFYGGIADQRDVWRDAAAQ